MTPERAPSEPGHGISWLSSTSASVKSLWLKSKCGNTRSITPAVNIGSGSEPAGPMRSVAARTAACRCAIVGFWASASATSDCKPESPATCAESCACAGPALAITNALAVRISCRTCIPLLANQFPAERAGARAVVDGASDTLRLGEARLGEVEGAVLVGRPGRGSRPRDQQCGT